MTDGTFGQYRLLSRLGTGGMGQVWRAVDTRKRREVALKLIRSDLEDRDFAARFHREAELAARLTSPYLVPIHDYGEIDGQLFLDMALIEGVDLGQLIRAEGALRPERAVTLAGQVARALGVAHRAGLVHRDVKPSNVLVADDDGDDHAYLIDFGLARRLEGTQLTRAGTLLGTLAYMAPERFRGPGDRRGDVYALACLLCEALTGQPPFAASSTPGIIYAHLRNPPPRVSERAGVPAALDEVVARGLAKDPADRYADAGELASAARAALALRGGGATTRSRTDDPADAPTARTPLAPPNQETTPPPRDTGITTPSRIVAVPEVGDHPTTGTAPAMDTGRTTPVPRPADVAPPSGDARSARSGVPTPSGSHAARSQAGAGGTPRRATPGPPVDGLPAPAADSTHRLPIPSVAAPPARDAEPDDVTFRFPGRPTATPPPDAGSDVTPRRPGAPAPSTGEAEPDVTQRVALPAAPSHDVDPDVTRRLSSRVTPRGTVPPPRAGIADAAGPPVRDAGEIAHAPGPSAARPRRLRSVALVALAAVIGAGLIAWIWTGQQYYVGAAGDRVVVYQGVQGSVLGIPLSQVAEDTGIRTADLQPSDRTAIVSGIAAAGGLEGAHVEVGRLRARLLPPCTTLGSAGPPPAAPATTVSAAPGQNCRPGG